MSDPAPSPESVPLREINAENLGNQPEEAEHDRGAEEVPDPSPATERAENLTPCCANILNAVHGVLDVIPMPASARAYLKVRWRGTFIGTILFLLLAMMAIGALIFVLNSSNSEPEPDPSTSWQRSIGPNGKPYFPLQKNISPSNYVLRLYMHMNDTDQPFYYEGRVAIIFSVDPPGPVNKFLIHADKHLQIDFKNFIIADVRAYSDNAYPCPTWDSFPYVNEQGEYGFRTCLRARDRPLAERWQSLGAYEIPQVARLDDDTLQVKVKNPLWVQPTYVILIHFNGTIRDDPPGFFRKKLHNSDDYWVATQFQSSQARKAFPCFDEPLFRAQFDFSICHPSTHTALSNTATLGFQDEPEFWPGDEVAWTWFYSTHYMPAHLFGFVVAPLESAELSPKRLPVVKMFAMERELMSGKAYNYTADLILNAIRYTDNYFKIESTRVLMNTMYAQLGADQTAMSKLYIVGLPTKEPIHSESLGFVLLREEEFFANTTASVDTLEKVARSVLHSIIHQWMSYYVTPVGLDDLWVYEALVRYIEEAHLQVIYKDWHTRDNFATQVIGAALNVDSLNKSNAVATFPRTPYYPTTMFDKLTYIKGAALFYMLDSHWPERPTLLFSVRKFPRFGGTYPADASTIFQNINDVAFPSNATAEDGLTVGRIMEKWTRDAGYPLVTIVRYKNSSDLSLYQALFDPYSMKSRQTLETEGIPAEECLKPGKHRRSKPSKSAWAIPIELRLLNGTALRSFDRFWMTTDHHRVCGGMPPFDTFIIANYGQAGYFRVHYDEESWNLIAKHMMNNPRTFSTVTRAQLIDDAIVLAKQGQLDFFTALQMPLALLRQEISEAPEAGDVGMFERSMRAVADVHDCSRGTKSAEGMMEYMRLLAASQWAVVDPPERRRLERASGHIDNLARRTSILLQDQATFWACYTAMPECTDWSVSLVREWKETHPADINAVAEHYLNTFCAAVRYGPDDLFDFLWNRYQQGGVSDKHKQEILWSLLCTTKEEKIMEVFKELPGQNLVDDTMMLWKKSKGQHISTWYAYKYQRSFWDYVRHRTYNSSSFDQIVIAVTGALTTPSDSEEIQRFRKAHKQSLLDVEDLLEENVLNIQRRLKFRAVIEENLPAALDKILPMAKALALKVKTDTSNSTSPAPAVLDARPTTGSVHEAADPLPKFHVNW